MARTHHCPICLHTFSGNPVRCASIACSSTRPADGWPDVLQNGDLLDRHYRVRRLLALGGAGITYLAREVGADGQPQPPDLAIKVLYRNRAHGSFLRRLANEAQILEELAHPHIVVSRGFVQRSGQQPYLVTRYEHGGTLDHHVLRYGGLNGLVAAGIVRQVLDALQVAHDAGVIHRDLKPPNVLLRRVITRNEIPHVRVADFGIAKVAASIGEGLTQAGAFIGTPSFAAPEQLRGTAATPKADLFALGAVLYFMLMARSHVIYTDRGDVNQMAHDLEHSVPPVLSENVVQGALGNGLQQALDGLMQVEPEKRWTVEETVVHFDRLLGLGDELSEQDGEDDQAPEVEGGFRAGGDERTRLDMGASDETDLPTPDEMVTMLGSSSDTQRSVSLARPLVAPPAGDIVTVSSGQPVWLPSQPMPLPGNIPGDATGLLRWLGITDVPGRTVVLQRLMQLDPATLEKSVRRHRTGGDPAVGRAIALLASHSNRDGWSPLLEVLIADPDPGVRCACAVGLGDVGNRSVLKVLGRALRDSDPAVRIGVVCGLSAVSVRLGLQEAARILLRGVANDVDPGVAQAVCRAELSLEA